MRAIQTLLSGASRRSVGTMNTALRIALSDGISVSDPSLQNRIVAWTGQLSESYSSTKGGPAKLRDIHLLLFDSHNKELAKRFLPYEPTSMVLLESDGLNASNQKQFVSRHLANLPSTSSDGAAESGSGTSDDAIAANGLGRQCRLEAYHAHMRDLIVPTKAKPFNARFLRMILRPDADYFLQQGVDEWDIRTVVVGTLPSSSLQMAFLRSLFRQLVTYLHSQHPWNNYHQEEQAYRINPFAVLTFLSTDVFAHFLCGRADVEVLRFYTKPHQHFSFLFNTLFEVRTPNGWDGYSLDHFRPNLGEMALKSHEEKLSEIGLVKDHFYPFCFHPRSRSELRRRMADAGISDPPRDILPLVFWMLEVAAKVRNSKPCNSELRTLLGDDRLELFDDSLKGGEVTPQDFFQRYHQVREVLVDPQRPVAARYQAFASNFLKRESKEYAD